MDKKLLALMAMFFIAFGTFTIMTVFGNQITTFTRASSAQQPSSQNSLIFAWPLTSEISKPVSINVFVRSTSNLPLQDRRVKLETSHGIINSISTEASKVTDSSGKANFSLTADSAGVAELKAWVDGSIQVSQKVSVKFE